MDISRELSKADIKLNPFEQFKLWFSDAANCGIELPNAMTIASATSEGKPSARTVLLKNEVVDSFKFYTNYNSRKGRELIENPFAALLFYWEPVERQIRIEGSIKKTTAKDSRAYFNTRPLESRIGAIASDQSQVITNRQLLEQAVNSVKEKGEFDCPPNWGGFELIPEYFEFWQGRENRLHDRISYTWCTSSDQWKIDRLAP